MSSIVVKWRSFIHQQNTYNMNSMTNHVQLLGNLGQDVELITFDSGKQVAKISLATTDYYKSKQGELVKNTQWHRLTAWGKTAQLMQEQLHKGTKVMISGSLEYGQYKDQNNVTRNTTTIRVHQFVRLTPATTTSPVTDGAPAAAVQKEALPF